MYALVVAAAYVTLAPNIAFAPDLPWHDGQRLAQLLVLLLVGAVVLLPANGRAVWQVWTSLPRWSRHALVTVALLGLVSGLSAPLPRWALLEWSVLLLLGVLALAVVTAWRVSGARREELLVAAFYASALAYGVKAVTMYVTMLAVGPGYGLGFMVEELFTGFSNVRFFSHVQTMLLPFLVLPLLWWGTTRARRALLFVVPALWWMLVIASGTRGSWVALLIGALVAVSFGGRTAWRWIGWQLAALLAGALAYVIFVLLVPDWLARPALFMHRVADIISLRGRDELWAIAFDLIVQHPWLGIGPMHYAQHLSVLATHPHNAMLQIMVEWRVPAALLVTALWIAAGLGWAMHVRRMCRSVPADHHALVLVALLAAITGASAQAVVDGIIVMPVSQLLFALLCGWALGCYLNAAKEGGQPEPVPATALAFRGTVLVLLAAMVWGVHPEIGRLEARLEAHLRMQPEGPHPKLLPRFWVQGLISE